MYQNFPVARLPEPLVAYIRRYGFMGKTVRLSEQPAGFTAIAEVDSERATHGIVFDLDAGQPVLEVVRPKPNFFDAVDFRVRAAQAAAEKFPIAANQCFIRVGMSTPLLPSTVTILVEKTTELLYFNLGEMASPLSTEEALYLMVVNGRTSKARQEDIATLTRAGYDMGAALRGLVEKGLIKASKTGAVTMTAEGRYRASQPDLRKYADVAWKIRGGGTWQP